VLTLSAHIMAGAAAHDRCPLVFVAGDGEHATTLGALVSDAEKVAAAFQARGIGPGDVVVVQLPGSYEGAVIQTAVGLCGAVLLPVVMIYGAREMEFVLRRSGAAAVVVPREHRGRQHAAVVLSELPGLRALKFAVIVGDR
jgi:cyclohexanecarboxylate-CoA ligase